MASVWYVVLNQASMKIFTRKNFRSPLVHMKTLTNDEVDLKDAELARHQPGSIPRGDAAFGRTVLNGSVRPHDLIVQDFAREVAEYLDDQRRKNQISELWMAAEPRFMGLVKKSLSDETAKMVREWISKDLEKADVSRLSREFTPPHFAP